jgi:hypothetical protein
VVAFAGELLILTAGSRFLRFLPWMTAGRRFFRSVPSSCVCVVRPGSPALVAWSPELLHEFGASVEGYDVVG